MTANQKKSFESFFSFVKFTVVLIILTTIAGPVRAMQCRDIFTNNHLPLGITVPSSTKSVDAPLYSHVTVNNVSSIFRHNYDRFNRSRFGCKAVVTNLPGEGPRVYFFPTGEGRKSWNIHHVEAVSVALNDPSQQLFLSNLPYLQGYQLTAQKINGIWKITRLDISSTLVYLHEKTPTEAPSYKQEMEMLNALISSIDKELRDFLTPQLMDTRGR